MKSVMLHAAGGAATNVVATLMTRPGLDELPVKLDAAFLDTSRSNIAKYPDMEEKLFLVENSNVSADTDGSGKIRGENGEDIIRSIKSYILEKGTGDYNIVFFSGAGGTGSVGGPEMIAEMKSAGQFVIGIMIEDMSDLVAAENCIKTTNTLHNIVEAYADDVIVSYHRNKVSFNRTNEEIFITVYALLKLFSGENDGLDTKDLIHWSQPHKVTEYEPGLYSLLITLGATNFTESVKSPVSIASIYETMDTKRLDVFVEYSTFGHCDLSDIRAEGDSFDQMHFALSSEVIDDYLHDLHQRTQKIKEEADARKSRRRAQRKSNLVRSERSQSVSEF